jgi:hypothetical protein
MVLQQPAPMQPLTGVPDEIIRSQLQVGSTQSVLGAVNYTADWQPVLHETQPQGVVKARTP